MKHYILVHGAWAGSWAFDEITPLLMQQGHQAVSIDLPGSEGNPQPISNITMDSYVETVIAAISAQPDKVTLVGHSLGGAVISLAAERAYEKIEKLIFVAALLLKDGDSAVSAMSRDPGGKLLGALTFSEDQSFATASEQTARNIIFNGVDDQVIQRSLPRMAEKQATEPFMATLELTSEKFGLIPKTYIGTANDKVISPSMQEEMVAGANVNDVHWLQSGHFPSLSVPKELAKLLL